jgi:serine/threonine-protein kinase
LQGARERFEEAIRQDSTYAPAFAGLATVYVLMGFYAYPGVDYYEAYGRAWRLADRAIALDPELAEGYAVRGILLTLAWGPAEPIAADFARALELRPNSPDVHLWYGPFLSRENRHEEALAAARQAIDLNPLAPGPNIGLAHVGIAARRPDVVVQATTRAMALEPGLMRPRSFRALGDLLSGQAERCLSLDLGPHAGVRGLCLYTQGRIPEAARLADSLGTVFSATSQDSSSRAIFIARSLAEYYAWTGAAEESLAWLERAYQLSPVGEDIPVIASAIYDRVRADPRFEAGLSRLNARIYERVESSRRSAGSR